jgi:hypothetical protein
MSLESRIQALEDHCNHSLANAKLIAAGGITSAELKVDALERPYLGEEEFGTRDPMDVEELAQENAQLRDELNDAIHLIGELSITLTRLSRA